VVEHFLGKEEVDSSILFNGSKAGVANDYIGLFVAGSQPATSVIEPNRII
jgi:hypothetical protein